MGTHVTEGDGDGHHQAAETDKLVCFHGDYFEMICTSLGMVAAGGGVTVIPKVIHRGINGTLAISLYWVFNMFCAFTQMV